ncbi:hypothetical protein T12_2242 [Trichinella patagoniensis]|uniref:Uncharacterized protein n=1 Tax=Trichinella patagoniensis TaxID=990121 RepID=A0A0V1A1P3_9BILA|nr:hypothetical protein T12_499 [Trichinella patagoniensis]KRY18307.1 hypothetical protein T12_2242 [Trichinella patagoniensis]
MIDYFCTTISIVFIRKAAGHKEQRSSDMGSSSMTGNSSYRGTVRVGHPEGSTFSPSAEAEAFVQLSWIWAPQRNERFRESFFITVIGGCASWTWVIVVTQISCHQICASVKSKNLARIENTNRPCNGVCLFFASQTTRTRVVTLCCRLTRTHFQPTNFGRIFFRYL